jgi:hypothetical protein
VHVHGGSPAGARVSVEAALERFGLPGMRLLSSDRQAPAVDGRRWPQGLRWSIDDRLASEGARKGRVLAIWQGQQCVGACAWHLHTEGPPVIFDLGCRDDLSEAAAARARLALMLCLRQIAAAREFGRDTSTLRWADRPLDRIPDRDERARTRQAVRRRAEDLQFTRMQTRPKWLRGHWARERRF